jgi:hypothetical protein
VAILQNLVGVPGRNQNDTKVRPMQRAVIPLRIGFALLLFVGLAIVGFGAPAEADVGASCSAGASASGGTNSPPTVNVTPPTCTITGLTP